MTQAATDDPIIGPILKWWRELHGDDKRRGDRAGRAELRRCAAPIDALMVPSAQRLLSAVNDRRHADDLLVVGIILASIEPGTARQISLARRLGKKPDGGVATDADRKCMSKLRFQALLEAMRSDDSVLRIRALRRAVALAGDDDFNVARLVRDILYFDDKTFRTWLYDYWQTFERGGNQPPADATVTENS